MNPREQAKNYLLPFAVRMNEKYELAHHLHLIAHKLQQIEQGKVKRLMIFMPPRHGKSQLSSIYFPAWLLGKHPDKSVIFTTYAQEVASDFGRKVRNLMSDDVYQRIFNVSLSEDSTAAHRFNTNKGGSFYAVGVNGPLTSRGMDVGIIDDPVKNREEADSILIQRKTIDWYKSTYYTRLTNVGALILIQTRWHENDLAGYLLRQPGSAEWDVLDLPAISPKGTALWPERFNIDQLNAIKQAIGSSEFSALYQQKPSAQEGNIIKRQWIKHWKQLPARFDMFVQSWDLSFKGDQDSDYVVGQYWGLVGGERYLIDQVRAQMDFPATLQAVRAFYYKHKKVYQVLVENKANGAATISTLKREIPGVTPYEPEVSKEQRLKAVSPQFEAGNIWLPDPAVAPWVNDYVEELVGFPKQAHDDQVDATTQVLLRFLNGGGYSLEKMAQL